MDWSNGCGAVKKRYKKKKVCKEAPVDKSREQQAFENDQRRRKVKALTSLAQSAKRFVDLLERLEKLGMEQLEKERNAASPHYTPHKRSRNLQGLKGARND